MTLNQKIRVKSATEANYDKLSRWYDWLAGSTEAKAQRAALGLLNAQPGEKILEIGFGTGRSLAALAPAVHPGGSVVGADLSGGMCQVAQGKIKRTRLDNIYVCQADALALPFRAGCFDAVFMSFTLELMAARVIPLVLQRCKEVLAENGRICITAIAKQDKEGIGLKLYQWAHEQFPHIVDCKPILVQPALTDAGFQIGQTTWTSLWGIPVATILARSN